MFGNLVSQAVEEFLREELELLGVQSNEEREEDISKINVKVGLISVSGAIQPNRH